MIDINKHSVNSVVPILSPFIISFRINRILKARAQHEVAAKWDGTSLPKPLTADVFKIIQDHCSWRVDSFCPSDELVYLLRGYEVGLTMVEVISAIERHYGIEFFDDDCNIISMQDLIAAIANELAKKP